MAWVGAATKKCLVADPVNWMPASRFSISRRPRSVLPTPMATATPARRWPWTSGRMWSCRACFFAWVEELVACIGEELIRKPKAGPRSATSDPGWKEDGWPREGSRQWRVPQLGHCVGLRELIAKSIDYANSAV